MANRSGAVLTLNHDSRFVRNGSVTQAGALKVSDLTGATGNRCGSNRHRERSAGAGVRLPGRVAELSHFSPLRLRIGGINGLLFPQMLHGVDIQPPSSRFYENVTSTNAKRSAARKLPPAAADSHPELAHLQLQAAELAGTRTILMVPLCKDGRLLGDDVEAAQFPDLLARSSEILRDLPGIALGDPRPLGFSHFFGIRHRRFRNQLTDMLANPDERAGEITINFGGDTNTAAQFARSVPDFGLKGRFVDLVKLDLQALEREIGSTSRRRGPGGAASFGGERRLVEFPRGKPIPPPRANARMPHGRLARLDETSKPFAYLARN